MLNALKRIRNICVGNVNLLAHKLDESVNDKSLSQIEQVRLRLAYKSMDNNKLKSVSFKDVGFRVFSQSDEDGILHYIFSVIGATNKICIDVAFASPFGANTTNLICNFGWQGLLVCGTLSEAKFSNNFFQSHPDTKIFPPTTINAWVTKENINDLIYKNNISGEIDLFSLDIDGVDYWIWDALQVVNPRVVVVECQTMWGNKRAVTVPYDPHFSRISGKNPKDFFGASLPAFVKLAMKKNYRLIGCNKYGFNAFFVRNDIVCQDLLPEVSIESCLVSPQTQHAIKHRLAAVEQCDWIEV